MKTPLLIVLLCGILAAACRAPDTLVESSGSTLSGQTTILYGQSATCDSGAAIGVVSASTDCDSLGSDATSSVLVDGECIDVRGYADNRQAACRLFKGGSTILYGQSAGCESAHALSAVGPASDCSALPSMGTMSVRVGGDCIDVRNYATTKANACELFKGGTTIIYGQSTTCESGHALAAIGPSTDCSALQSMATMSVKVGSECIDVANYAGTKTAVCNLFKGGSTIIYGQSSTCESGHALAAVGPATDCNTMPGMSAESVRVSGQCLAVSGTVASQCTSFHGSD